MGIILLVDAGFQAHYLSKELNMKSTFVVFAILLILGMIQVKVA